LQKASDLYDLVVEVKNDIDNKHITALRISKNGNVLFVWGKKTVLPANAPKPNNVSVPNSSNVGENKDSIKKNSIKQKPSTNKNNVANSNLSEELLTAVKSELLKIDEKNANARKKYVEGVLNKQVQALNTVSPAEADKIIKQIEKDLKMVNE
jgi:hypothetical protein